METQSKHMYLNLSNLWILHQNKSRNYTSASATHMQINQAKQIVKRVSQAHTI